MPVLPELIAFLRRPTFTKSRVPVTLQSLYELLKLLGLTYVLALIAVMIATPVYALVSGSEAQVSESFEEMVNGPQFFIMAVIFAPISEEMLFRSWLGRAWGVLLVMPILLMFSAVLALLGQEAATSEGSMIGIIILLGVLGVYLRRYFATKQISDFHDTVVKGIFPYVFWGAASCFALIHMGNYIGEGFQPLVLFLIMPQFIVGAILGYVRMRYGLIQAIGFHAAYNGLFVGLAVLG